MLHGNRGFTLIELMVVIAIVGILAAIAIPQFSKYREKTYIAMALNDLRNVMTAEEAEYASDDRYVAQGCGLGPAWLFGGSKHITKGVGYCINASALGRDYAAFTGHKATSREFAGSSDRDVMYKDLAGNAATAAQAEAATTLSGWGGTPL